MNGAEGCGGAGAWLQSAAADWLRQAPALAGVAVFDASPVRAAAPYLVVEDPVLSDWSAKDWTGREGVLAVVVHDAAVGAGERPVRARALAAVVEAVMPGLPPHLGGGWRMATVRLSRSRVARMAGDRWTATAEWRVRLYRPDA